MLLQNSITLAFIALSLFSLLYFSAVLFPSPENLFLFHLPISRTKAFLAHMTYGMLLNGVWLFSITVPQLVVLGVLAETGWIYFLALIPLSFLLCLLTTCLGALLAAGAVLLLRRVASIWRALLRYHSAGSASLAISYLASTMISPLRTEPLQNIGLIWTLGTFVAGSLTEAIGTESVAYAVFSGMGKLLIVSLVSGIFALGAYQYLVRGMCGFSLSTIRSRSLAPLRPACPFLKKDLALFWRGGGWFQLLGYVAIGFGVFLFGRTPGNNGLGGRLLVTLAMVLGTSLTAHRILQEEGQGILLLRTSPASVLKFLLSKFAVVLLIPVGMVALAVVALGAAGWLVDSAYRAILPLVPMYLALLLVPLATVLFCFETWFFIATRRSPDTKIASGQKVLYMLTCFPFVVAAEIVVFRLSVPLLLLSAVAFSVAAGASIVAYLFLARAARHLAIMEWL
jgi:hypothetical protein